MKKQINRQIFKVIISLFFVGFLFFGFTSNAFAVTNLYYSVGQNTTDHKTGSPTVTIASGVATFSVAQTATNMGVGDAVTYNTNVVAYITGKTSTSVWTVMTAIGGVPDNITDSTVVSIAHAFSSLNAAINGSTPGVANATHFNSKVLTAGDGYTMNIPLYYDTGSDTTALDIGSNNSVWTTDATRYIHIYTPYSTTSEVNQSQRHTGKWTANAYTLSFDTTAWGIQIDEKYVLVEGLQIEGGNNSTNTYAMIYGYYGWAPTQSIQITNNIFRLKPTFTYSGYGIHLVDSSDKYKIWNNIFYDLTNAAINVNNSGVIAVIYNNTFANNSNGITFVNAGSSIAKNNLFYNNTTATAGTFPAGTDYNSTSSASMGYTVTGSGNTHDRLSQTFTFIDAANKDFHIASNDAGARDVGVDLSADGSLAFNTDIDAQSRPYNTVWDIGADEYLPPPATTFTFTGPSSGVVDTQSSNFTVTPDYAYTGTITLTPSGAGSTGLSATVLTFSDSATPQTFTITPTAEGDVILTPTNNGGLANPANLTYTVSGATDATLSIVTTTVKGVALIGLGTPNATIGSATGGTITITRTQSFDTTNTGSYITTFLATNPSATVNRVVKYASGASITNFDTDAVYTSAAIADGDFFIIKVTASNGSTVLYYKVTVTVVASAGDIIAVRISSDARRQGWVGEFDISGVSTGGTYDFNLDTNNVTTANTPYFTITSLGYDASGNATTISRTVYVMNALRKVYPDNASNDETSEIGYVTVRASLSEWIYSSDTLTFTAPTSFYTQGGTPSNAITSYAVTNGATQAYPKVVANWSWPGYSRITGSTFNLSAIAFHRSAQQGQSVRAVKYTCTDQLSNSATATVTGATIDSTKNDTVPVAEYIGTISTTSLTQGDTLTCNFQAYPWYGDSGSILNTGDGTNTMPTPLYAPQYYVLDKTGAHGSTIAVVDATLGNNDTGVAIDSASFDSGTPPASFQNIYAAANAIAAYNNTNHSRNDVSGGVIYLKEGSHAWTGGTLSVGAAANNATWLTVTKFPGTARANVLITSTSGDKLIGHKVKFEDVKFTNGTGVILSGLDALWVDYSTIAPTAGVYGTFDSTTVNYITASNVSGSYSPTGNSSIALMRGNLSTASLVNSIQPAYTVLGNSLTNSGDGSISDAYTTTPAVSNGIYAFNLFYANADASILNKFYANTIGTAVIQNIFERSGVSSTPLIQIAADATTYESNNVLVWNNTFIGQRDNMAYADSGTSGPIWRRDWSIKNNIFDDLNVVTDTDAHGGTPSADRYGNHSVVFGTGLSGNLITERVGAGYIPQFLGMSSISGVKVTNPIDPNYVDDASYLGTGLGNGDYHLTMLSPTVDLVPSGETLLPYDIAGVPRSNTSSSSGAYEFASDDATLNTFTISSGTLSPSFASGTITYTASVANNVTSITVTPTASQGSSATITVNAVSVNSGSASGSISLDVGENIITTIVTAPDTTTTKTYTTTVTRLPSSDATLSNFTISEGTLSPVFDANTITYTASVATGVTSMTVTPTATQGGSSTITVNGSTVASSVASSSISLDYGDNIITVIVTAPDAVTTKTYTTTVTRAVTTIVATAIAGVTAPVTGETPVTTVTAGTGYTGTVTWSDSPVTFASNTAYTATITLSATSGYTLTGVTLNQFTISGASATNSANAGVITAVFPATDTTIVATAIAGVTAPVTGATPVTTVTAGTGYTGTVTWNGTPSTFASATIYTATITLSATSGYTLTGVTLNQFTISGASATNSANAGVITAVFPATDTTIVATAIAGVTAPVTGATPVTTVTAGTGYTGTVTWNGTPSTFASATIYTATITLSATSGYTLTGVTLNQFTISGASATNSANAGVITAVFPATDTTIVATAIAGVTAPVTGETPVTTVTAGTGYTGTVTWNGTPSTFASATIYTATITLSATSGYTLTGVTLNQFTISGASATNSANAGVITAVFPETVPNSTPITAIAVISGTIQVGSVLTAGALTPAEATASYQWYSSSTSGGIYSVISGATSSTYTLVSDNAGKYIKVTATGTGSYDSSVTSTVTTVVTAPVASITVTGAGSAITVVNRSTLQMSGAVLPSYATNQVLSWSITNGTGTATIDSSTGLLSALGAGTVTVNASATDGSGITGTLVVTVTAAPGGGRGSASISFASNISSTNTTTTSIISPSSPSSPSSTTSIVSITPSSSNSYNFGTTTLKNGSKGEAVKELQRFLNDKLNLGLEIDGVLGPKTISVIKKWQKDNGLTPDGLIGAKTKALMNTLVPSVGIEPTSRP